MSEVIDESAEWWDVYLDASTWWSAQAVTPIQAALLLAGQNPNRKNTAVESAESDTGAGIGPVDFERLKNIFENADHSQRRRLRDWIDYARDRDLHVHPWVVSWEAVFADTVAIPPEVASGNQAESLTRKFRRKWDDRTKLQLLDESRQPGMSAVKLAALYGCTPQFIRRKLRDAKTLAAPRKAEYIDGLNWKPKN